MPLFDFFILYSSKLLVNSNPLPPPCFRPWSRTLLEKNTQSCPTSLLLDTGPRASSNPLILPTRILYSQVLSLAHAPRQLFHIFSFFFTSPSTAYPPPLSGDGLAPCNTENRYTWQNFHKIPLPHLSTYQHVCNYHTPALPLVSIHELLTHLSNADLCTRSHPHVPRRWHCCQNSPTPWHQQISLLYWASPIIIQTCCYLSHRQKSLSETLFSLQLSLHFSTTLLTNYLGGGLYTHCL